MRRTFLLTFLYFSLAKFFKSENCAAMFSTTERSFHLSKNGCLLKLQSILVAGRHSSYWQAEPKARQMNASQQVVGSGTLRRQTTRLDCSRMASSSLIFCGLYGAVPHLKLLRFSLRQIYLYSTLSFADRPLSY